MLIAQIDFEITEIADTDLQNSGIFSLLADFAHDGRIGSHYSVLKNDSTISSLVTIPAADAFSNFGDNPYIPDSLKRLDEVKISRPIFKILGKDLESAEVCQCQKSTGYILYTGGWSDSVTPLYCFDCFQPVPLYWLPRPENDDFFAVYVWQSDYKACDQLQTHCQTGERFALKEMLDPASSLSQAGLAICRDLSARTGKPVYYFLYKYYGKSLKTEKARACPQCGGAWILDEPLFKLFDFKCDNCHLLSNIANGLR